MSKGQQTRQSIIAKSAPLFNQRGYDGASLSAIMQATGLKKGGIYNHFANKDELALAAFQHNWGILHGYFERARHSAGDSATAQLIAVIEAHQVFVNEQTLPGGCPLLNTAIDSDDGHFGLREQVREAITEWQAGLQQIIRAGIISGEFRRDIDVDALASVIISAIEGGIMLSKLYGDVAHIERAVDHLKTHVLDCVVSAE